MISEKSKISPQVDVIGKVQIDYTDEITGKVKERICGNNHVFLDSFNTSAWWDRLSGTTYDTFFLTDDDTSPDDNFQYLRGNIIGWGRVGNEASGAYRGKFLASESIIDGDINNGVGRRWKYTYTFTGDQVLQPIKSLGLSMQYSSEIDVPVRRWKYPTNLNTYTSMRNNLLYYCANGIITVFNPFTGTSTTIDVTNVVGNAQGNMCVGFADDSTKAYVFRVGSAVGNRAIYEFLDETFIVQGNVYSCSNWTTHPDSRGFVVHGNKAWFYASGWYKSVLGGNVNPTISPIPASVYSNARLATSDGHIFAKNGYAFKRYSQNVATNELPVWDLENDKIAAFINTRGNTSTNYQGCSVFAPSAPSGHSVLLSAWENNATFNMKQAFTCYVLPNDAPERPDGAGIKISYQIDVNY
ncbi:hypothetical protein FACS1894132_05600 [Clostridia bacterium]|nr:hypothetical protein FACS1894132_05600 [Clostridia bacterium]